MKYFYEARVHDHTLGKYKFHPLVLSVTPDLFNKLMKKKLITNKAGIFNIYMTADEDRHLEYSMAAGFVSVNYNLHHLRNLQTKTVYNQKKTVLDVVYEVLCHMAVKENWDLDVIMDAYNRCLEMKIQNEWWFRDKLFASAGKKYYAGLRHIFDMAGYEIYLVLFDNDQKELARHKIFNDNFQSHTIQRFSWKSKDTIRFKFEASNKEYVYTVDELLRSKAIKLPTKKELNYR